MSRTDPFAEDFLRRFLLPLVRGGEVHVGRPLLARGAARLLAAVDAGLDGTPAGEELLVARRRALAALVPSASPPLLGADRTALLLGVALHDLLFLLHPDAARLSHERTATILSATIRLGQRARAELPRAATELRPGPGALLLGAPTPRVRQASLLLLGRHTLLGRLPELVRTDALVESPRGEQRYLGMDPPARPRWLFGGAAEPAERVQVALLPELLRLDEGRGAAALLSLLGASPLTDLLWPRRPGLPLRLDEHAAWLRLPLIARLVTGRLAELGTAAALALLGGELTRLLQRRPRLPLADAMTLVCLHSHLHALAAVERKPPPVEAPESCALYAVIYRRWPLLAAPRDVLRDPRLRPRLDEHARACRELAGPAPVQLAEILLDLTLMPELGPELGPELMSDLRPDNLPLVRNLVPLEP
ncbi:MAG: hypothetical protein U1A78_05295 [Polyangia bacterium]